jgi:glycosyltransferase involved in cell wall biosynthesis
LKVLAIATLYPSATQPVHAVFVEQRVAAMAKRFPVTVLAPIPWFPFTQHMPRYRHRRKIALEETRHGIRVRYPRFLSFPLIFKPFDGFFLFLTCLGEALRLRSSFRFDRIDAHLAYPDGFAAVLLGKILRLPVSVTLRGHDVNDLPRFPVRRRQVAWVLSEADVVFAVADALREGAIALGASPDRSWTVGNGVDPNRFRPLEREEARARLGLPGSARVVLSVGHLVERKGFHHLVQALPFVLESFPETRLCIVGAPGEEGDYSRKIREAARTCGVEHLVTLAGAVPNEELAAWYSAADVFCLASGKEGRANVLLEALACGTPVVATNVWGTPEILSNESVGLLVKSPSADCLGSALVAALTKKWDRAKIVEHSRGFSWEAAAERIESTLASLSSGDRRPLSREKVSS